MRQILLHLILLLATLEVGGSFARIPLVAAADESTSAFRSDTREAFSACQGSDHSLQAYMRGYLVNYLDYQRSGNKDSRVNAAKCEQVILDQHLLNHAKAAALIAREGSVGHAGFDKNLQAAFDNKLKSSEEELRLYLKALEYIESQARQPSSASAVAKLAFSLQRAWEAKYELLFYQQNRDQLNNSTQLVTDLVNIGAAAGTTRSLFATKYVKNYFTVFNKTFQDVLGLEFKGFRYGVQASTELNRKEGSIQIPLSERKISLLPADMKIRPFQIPPPPSYVLHMAFPALDERLIEAEESAFVLDSVANGASMLAFTVALNVEHKLLENKAIPKKLRLFAVIGSAALTYAATEWGKDTARDAIEGLSEAQLENKLVQYSNEIVQIDLKNYPLLLSQVRRLVNGALSLKAKREEHLLGLQVQKEIAIAKAMHDVNAEHGQALKRSNDPALGKRVADELKRATAAATEEFNKQIREINQKQGGMDPVVARYIVRNHLENLDLESGGGDDPISYLRGYIVAKMRPPFRDIAVQYVNHFTDPGYKNELCQSRENELKRFMCNLVEVDAKVDRLLVKEVRSGGFDSPVQHYSKDSNRMLLEALALLHMIPVPGFKDEVNLIQVQGDVALLDPIRKSAIETDILHLTLNDLKSSSGEADL